VPHETETDAPDSAAAVLIAQYHVVATHHTHFMDLIWQVPAVASGIAGVLLAVGFGRDIPPLARVTVMLIGVTMMAVMTVALERFRMFQLRRRKDMEEIESELIVFGGRRIVWDGTEIAAEIRRGEFVVRSLPAFRWEGFVLLRALMYLLTVILLASSIVSIAQLFDLF
jgi:hypothetical protein